MGKDGGSTRHGYGAVRQYFHALEPVLEDWIRHGIISLLISLREITREHVVQANASRLLATFG